MKKPSARSEYTAPSAVSSLSEEKKQLRRRIRQKARSLDPSDCCSADLRIRELLFALPEYKNASRLFCFVSRPEEVDTHFIIRKALSEGKTIAVPRCEGDGIMHAHCIVDPETDLHPGMYGILEPSPETPLLDPASFDLILVPCCSCSHSGRRLGFGGGFYDRYLKQTSAVTAALCREALISDYIPIEAFDRNMDIVLTEAGVFRNA